MPVGTAQRHLQLDVLCRRALKVFLPVAPPFLAVQVDISGGGEALGDSVAAVEVQGVALRLAGVLAERNLDVETWNREHFHARGH